MADTYESVANNRRLECLLNRLVRHTSKKTSKFRVTGLCEGNSPVSSEFTVQNASKAENVSIRRHHDMTVLTQSRCKVVNFPQNTYKIVTDYQNTNVRHLTDDKWS